MDRDRWISVLEAASGPALTGIPLDAPRETRYEYAESFRDELGHRRAVDAPFLAHALELDAPLQTPADTQPDALLWYAVTDQIIDPRAIIDPDDAPLLPSARGSSLEAWTESELCALHALWTIARVRADQPLTDRCMFAAAWHVAELQPDNATNTPWAIHVFIEYALQKNDPAANIHAEMLLHNAQSSGRPDTRSALVLRDTARELQNI